MITIKTTFECKENIDGQRKTEFTVKQLQVSVNDWNKETKTWRPSWIATARGEPNEADDTAARRR